MNNSFIKHSILLLVIMSLFYSCNKKKTADKNNQKTLDSLSTAYYEGYLKLHPIEATNQGDNRYNDQLPNSLSKEHIAKEIQFYSSIQNGLKTIDYSTLPDEKKVIYDVLDFTLKDKIEYFAYHPEYFPFTQFSGLPLDFPLLGSGSGNQPFETEKDYKNWLKRMEQFPVWMETATKNFKQGAEKNMILPKSLVVKMIEQMKAPEIVDSNINTNIFFGPIKQFPKDFTAEQKEKYRTLFQETISEKIIPSYLNMGNYLEKEYLPKARTSDGYNELPNGEEIYKYYVKSWTTTKLTPEEINDLGLQQVEMLRTEMKKVQQTLGYKGTLEEFLNDLKTDPKAMPYSTDKDVMNAFNDVLNKVEAKLPTMFTVFPKTKFEIRQTEKFREATASAEYIPGTPDGARPGIFYIPLPNPKAFNVTSGMESLFLHEAIPGHHFQVSLQQENESLPKFMRFGWFGAFGEGWAHYCETLGPDFDLYKDPYQKMGYLSDQMLRAVRLVIDTGLHTGKMNREEAIAYFLSNVAYDKAGAIAEVERYMALPGQALSYKIGALHIKDLRDKYTSEMGKDFSLAKFHDELLSQGCLPLSVLDRKLENWSKKVTSTKD